MRRVGKDIARYGRGEIAMLTVNCPPIGADPPGEGAVERPHSLGDREVAHPHFAERAVHVVDEALGDEPCELRVVAGVVHEAMQHRKQMQRHHLEAALKRVGYAVMEKERRAPGRGKRGRIDQRGNIALGAPTRRKAELPSRSHPCHIRPPIRPYCKGPATGLATGPGNKTMRIEPHLLRGPAIAILAGLALSACVGETLHRGYIPTESALQQVQVGAPREQVLIALGTPSTTADFGGEVFYYISQVTNRPVAFLNPHVVDQSVLAVYFDADSQVTRVGQYGLQDGQVIDLVSRTTPTGGRDFSFLGQLLGAAANPSALPSAPGQ